MSPSLIARNRLEMALRNNGYHSACEAPAPWQAAEATFAPGRCYVSYQEGSVSQAVVATDLPHVGVALVEEGAVLRSQASLPLTITHAFVVSVEALPVLVRRIFELSRSLPNAPLDRFTAQTAKLPRATETEQLVVQRIGQDIFRDALMDFWSGRCAVTGLDQPELLRASHMKPWGDCDTDGERLDPMNGLLLAPHWDLAFDSGLVTFEENGDLRLSKRLTSAAVGLLAPTGAARPSLSHLKHGHQAYLRFHRQHVWRD